MKCERARNMWMLAADERLSWWRSLPLSRHMASCGECRKFAAGSRAVTDALAGLPAPEPRASLAAALHLEAVRALEPARASARAGHRRLIAGRFAFGAAGAGAAALALFIVLSGEQPVQTTLEQDLVRAESGIESLYTPTATDSPKGSAGIEDQMNSIEREMKCLELELENPTWNSLEGGTECNES